MSVNSVSLLKKLFLSAVPVLIASLTVAYVIYGMASKKDEASTRAVEMVELAKSADLAMIKMSEALRGYMINPTDEREFQNKETADAAFNQYSEKLKKLAQDFPEIIAQIKKMEDFDASTLNKSEDEVMALIKKRDADAIKFYNSSYAPARSAQVENFKKLEELVHVSSEKILTEVQENRINDAVRAGILLILAVWAGVGVMIWITAITIRKVGGITKKLNEYSTALSRSSSQIAEMSQGLSAATTEQAAALQETSASVEEMSSMVQKNSENARNTATTSNASKDQAEQGKVVVEKMIQSMEEIKLSNTSIMEQVNHSNSQIGEIVKVIQEIGNKTKVINDIVFQTKLLSFNASVEAARAGENGKGFAVVAEEVGNLAQMSGNAAKEISTMLHDSIQKVESIVKDTKIKVEALIVDGKAKVENGTSVARQCGDVLTEIVRNVMSVSQMAGEISIACQEQAQGVQEINKAMSQLDQVTQQNASTSQDSANAAKAVSDQASALTVSVVQLTGAIEGEGSKSYLLDSAPVEGKMVSAPAVQDTAPRMEPGKVIPLKKSALKKREKAKLFKSAVGGGSIPSGDDPNFETV